jgi:hypothetical protein
MNFEDRLRITEELIATELELSKSKGEAYAGQEDTLANFKRNGKRWGMSKYQTWGVYFGKHIDSIENAVQRDPDRPVEGTEGLRGRINDARVYLALLACLLEEDGLL